MSLEELWQLFPIKLTEHNPIWSQWYAEETVSLKNILPFAAEFYHIGSTAVDNIWAKPIVDILIAVKSKKQLKEAADILQNHGYIIMSSLDSRISLNKGYTENGFAERVFHIHIRLENDIDEVYFKDYLNSHPDVAKQYEALKLDLLKKYEHNRDAYTDAKTEFVKRYTALAKLSGKVICDCNIRTMKPCEYPFLDEFLYNAIFIPQGVEPPPKNIILNEDLQVYVKDFGLKASDVAVVAEVNGKIVGAAWARIMDDYGHIDNDTPSLAISLIKEYRGLKIGTALMCELLDKLRTMGFKRVSLSVQKSNYAVNLYKKVDFSIFNENEEDYIMVCNL